jgi:ATP-binding cassette, subfamily C, bacterial PrsD
VRLDGATLDQWEPDDLGRHVGYLPQDVELFEGTVAENIARFQPDASAQSIIAAAKSAGAHDMILQLADGYDTKIGEGGAVLSGGQRQRVALARALYGDPFLVVLDEPNASLDGAGDEALNQAILSVRQRGGIVIVITHRPAALGNVDLVAIMEGGRIKSMGPRDEVLQSVMKRNSVAPPQPVRATPATPLREVS